MSFGITVTHKGWLFMKSESTKRLFKFCFSYHVYTFVEVFIKVSNVLMIFQEENGVVSGLVSSVKWVCSEYFLFNCGHLKQSITG